MGLLTGMNLYVEIGKQTITTEDLEKILKKKAEK